MTKKKSLRIKIILECISCVKKSIIHKGISRYITQKNRQKAPHRLELKKFCPYCYKHTIHGEILK
uniref:Large ribosomal subunit protein bL33c n=1 Tax=Monotropa uniflora TaxID=50148 RepID=A0A221SR19_MONUN|nr:ribosomal protein L33 [Monotropa uniflora]ASN78980.1 ribosomal protein L33 [Monotropa uniflora]